MNRFEMRILVVVVVAVVVVALIAGCAVEDAERDARHDVGLGDTSAVDGGAAADGTAACPQVFSPCGGDVVGVWSLDTVCPAGGASLTKPMDHPYADLPACSGGANQATFTSVYGGTVTLAAGGASTVKMSVHAELQVTFTAACVLAAAGGSSAAAACPGLTTKNGKKLDCQFAAGLCQCSLKTQPETETITDTYKVTGTDLVINTTTGEKMSGPFCVTKDELVIRGVVGWAYWVLHRP